MSSAENDHEPNDDRREGGDGAERARAHTDVEARRFAAAEPDRRERYWAADEQQMRNRQNDSERRGQSVATSQLWCDEYVDRVIVYRRTRASTETLRNRKVAFHDVPHASFNWTSAAPST